MRTFWRGDGVRRRVEVDVSQQLFDQTPGGVLDQAIAQELGQANGTGMDVTVVTALLGTSGIVTKTWTDASPTVPENWPALMDLRQLVHQASGEQPDTLVLAPRRLSYLDTSAARPLPFRVNIVASPSIPPESGRIDHR